MADTDEVETTTFTIEAPDGETDELTLPTGLVDLLRDEGETQTKVIGDMATLSMTQQAHALVHHSHGEVDEAVESYEAAALELFEERFGMTYGEATGHSH